MTEQGYPPRQPGDPGRPGRSRVRQEPGGTGWQMIDAFDAFDERAVDDDVPPWAVPGGIEPVRPVRRPQQQPRRDDSRERPPADRAEPEPPAGPGRTPRKSRAAAARRRRSKRRLVVWGGALLVVAAVVAAGYQLTRSPAPKSRYITSWQPGELPAVPDACHVADAGALRQYLAGTPTRIQPYNYQAQSQCTYTVDAKPTFRVLNITAQA